VRLSCKKTDSNSLVKINKISFAKAVQLFSISEHFKDFSDNVQFMERISGENAKFKFKNKYAR